MALILISVLSVGICGCGTTRENVATSQLVTSEAVDLSIQHMDFRPLSGRTVYFDSGYIRAVKGDGIVNSDYVISGLRQQMLAAGCLLQDSAQDAEIIIEGRIGTLGADNHMVTYGIPENNSLTSAASLLPNSPSLPALPEIAFAKREAREAAAKIAAFAYDRETRQPLWQSGVRHSVATAKSTWVMGIGPFQGGSIRDKTKLAGSGFRFGRRSATGSTNQSNDRPAVDYTAETRFNQGWPDFSDVGHGAEMIASSPVEKPDNQGGDGDPAAENAGEQAAEKVAEAPASDSAEKTKQR
ncbi:hypothetical protein NHH03_26815 [Stieleria sp. TO1_6]|uniref:DUF6655 family protein n=1 Tax=Stieleria tagensis TaxID=2956795 RepID=UPI0028C1FB52|nr:DUF6655 family protein [Stieleria tagensis]MCO8125380.1 hypothetical protein [Stieleria tagensis]